MRCESAERSGEFAGKKEKTMSAATDDRTAETSGQIAPVVLWHDLRCGWKGPASELKLDYWQGILCSASCPRCGGDWPFLFDEWDDMVDEENHPEWEPTNREKNLESLGKRLRMWS